MLKQYFKRILKALGILLLLFLLLSTVLTLPLRWINPSSTAFTLRDSRVTYDLTQYWTQYDKVAPDILLAIIAAEDQKFPLHDGLDIESIKKALSEKRSRPRGASTISQQLVKNLYLWPGRSLFRKGVEAWLTLCMEFFVSKKRILELYVNVVEFGPGVYGAGLASYTFFKRSPDKVNRLQASLLAAVLPNPKQYSVKQPSRYVYDRAYNIRRSMWALGDLGYLESIK
jgi:monofunctional biosynthetic peptidoglycan transglycosylase